MVLLYAFSLIGRHRNRLRAEFKTFETVFLKQLGIVGPYMAALGFCSFDNTSQPLISSAINIPRSKRIPANGRLSVARRDTPGDEKGGLKLS